MKTVGKACNMDCKYCFEKDKHVVQNNWTPTLLEELINRLKNSAGIVFHGGEPLITGKRRFCQLLDVVRKYYPQKITSVKLQTNGTLIDEEWITILFDTYADLSIELAMSLDGTERMNNLRVDKRGENTFKIVRNAFELLGQRNISSGMLSVISKNSLALHKDYIDFISSIADRADFKHIATDKRTPIEILQLLTQKVLFLHQLLSRRYFESMRLSILG